MKIEEQIGFYDSKFEKRISKNDQRNWRKNSFQMEKKEGSETKFMGSKRCNKVLNHFHLMNTMTTSIRPVKAVSSLSFFYSISSKVLWRNNKKFFFFSNIYRYYNILSVSLSPVLICAKIVTAGQTSLTSRRMMNGTKLKESRHQKANCLHRTFLLLLLLI